MIWVLSGTESGRELVTALLEAGKPVVATTGTGYRKDLYEEQPGLVYIPGKLEREGMWGLIKEYSVNLIIDATHPYSVEVSSNAITVSQKTGTRYIRYEKKNMDIQGTLNFKGYPEVSDYLLGKTGNVMLATGTDRISLFSKLAPERLYVRIVPFLNSVEESLNAGIRPGNIIAMSFKLSAELNNLLYRDLGIKHLVTKEPGDTAGMREMIESALESGVEVLVVQRPEMDYPEVITSIDEIIKECR